MNSREILFLHSLSREGRIERIQEPVLIELAVSIGLVGYVK